jgi:hypothetical protein
MAGLTEGTDLGPAVFLGRGSRINPYHASSPHGTPPRLYQRLAGYPSTGTSLSEDTDVGPPGTLPLSGETVTERALSGALLGTTTDATASTQTVTITWYGAHLTGGRRQ